MRARWMRHHNWQRLLLRASKSSPSDAAIAVTVRRLFLLKYEFNRCTEGATETYCHFVITS
jgi:hypothetical protein